MRNPARPRQRSRKKITSRIPADQLLLPFDFRVFNGIINNIGDELMLIDVNGRIVFVNDAVVDGMGIPREDLLTRRVTDFFLENTSVQQWQQGHLKKLLEEKKPVSFQIDRKTRRGGHETIAVTAVAVPADGQQYVLSIARNITRLVNLERALQEAIEFYHVLCEGAGDPILIFDLKGNITYANSAAERHFKYPVGRLVGMNFRNLVHSHSVKDMAAAFHRSEKNPGHFGLEVRVVSADREEIPYEMSLASVMQEGRVVAVHTISRDLRSRKRLEHLVIEGEKMKGIQYFLTGTAMELRNPLLGLQKKVETLMNKYRNKDFEYVGYREYRQLIESLEGVSHQIKYCADTTERLVTLTQKRIHIKRKVCHAGPLIRDLVTMQQERLRMNHIKVVLHLTKQMPPFPVSPMDFQQIMTSLINNAVEAMPGGGRLLVRTAFLVKTRQLLVEVSDNGVGISKENLGRIMEPFFTTKQRGVDRNSGLGLTIVYSLVKTCRGTMTISSNLRKGTSVRVFFPVKQPHQKSGLKNF